MATRRQVGSHSAPRGRGSAGGPASSRVQAPVNAAEAAKRAARANDEDLPYLRSAAAGTKREAAAPARSPRGVRVAAAAIGIALAVAVIYVVGGALVAALLADGVEDAGAAVSGESFVKEDKAVTVDPSLVEAEDRTAWTHLTESIGYDGYLYFLAWDEEGGGCLAYRAEDADESYASLAFALTGEPAGLACYDGMFYAVSNGDGVYYVQSFYPADGVVPTDYLEGDGTVAAVGLDGSTLTLSGEGGELTVIELGD